MSAAEAREVSERRRAEELSRESEGRYRALFEALDEGFCVIEVLFDESGKAVDYRFLETNPAFDRQTGLVGVVGKRMRELAPGHEAHWFETYGRVAVSGEPTRFVAEASALGRWYDVYAFRFGTAAGRTVGVLFNDVTERRRTEQALRESEGRLSAVLHNMPAMVYIVDAGGRFLFINRQWEPVFGLREEQVVGRTVSEFFPKEVAEQFAANNRKVMETGRPVECEEMVPQSDGPHTYISVKVPLMDASGKAYAICGISTDITDRKRAEEALRAAKDEAERASEAKSEFLATLSHELRTPLTPVLLTTSLLESSPLLADELREDVATIRRNVELESRLISDLLDLTRIAKGKLQLDEHDVDLHLIVRSAIDICQREASARVVVELGAKRHVVRGDSTRLAQVFWNLINNAQKFTPPEGFITIRSVNPDGGGIRVEVSDTGAGIDEAVLPKLFTAFEQGEIRAIRQQAGLGLGLAISKRLVEAHRGKVGARSGGRGRGATFWVELPVVDVFGPAAVVKRPVAGGMAERPLKILLVEDNEPTLRVMEKLLRQVGHTVTGVTTAAGALGAAGREEFDLIVSDLGLPDGSGLDVMRQLRERYTGRAIALTGYGMEGDIAASREAGFAEHLTKPVDRAALEAAIRRVSGEGE